MDFKLNKMRGMSTLKEDRKLDNDLSRELQNLVPEIGQDVVRNGFVKCNNTKYDSAIQGIFDYRTRYGVYMPIIGTGGSDGGDDGGVNNGVGSYYTVAAPAGITSGSNFILTITMYDIDGNRDYSYGGTADLTENGAGSLNTATLTFTQGQATSATMQYDGTVDQESLTITATDDSDSTVYGSDTTVVTYTAPPAFSDVALNKPATASSAPWPTTFGPDKVNDGNGVTSWYSQNADNEWWHVDLEASYTLSRYSISFWEYNLATGDYITEFKIQYSTNDSDWSDAVHVTGNSEVYITESSFTAKTGRYWRYLGLARGGGGDGHIVTNIELSE